MPEADAPHRLQLHLTLPYKIQVRHEPRVAAYLARGYRVEQLQRITDREVLVTLAQTSAEGPTGA